MTEIDVLWSKVKELQEALRTKAKAVLAMQVR